MMMSASFWQENIGLDDDVRLILAGERGSEVLLHAHGGTGQQRLCSDRRLAEDQQNGDGTGRQLLPHPRQWSRAHRCWPAGK